jgi:hypothetical protein
MNQSHNYSIVSTTQNTTIPNQMSIPPITSGILTEIVITRGILAEIGIVELPRN